MGQAKIRPPVGVDEAQEMALRSLETRARSEAEIGRDLARRGVDPAVVETVVARLSAVGLIDDAEFARQWIDQRRGSKGLGAGRLRQELEARGVAAAVIGAALAQTAPGDEEADVALAWARRRARTLAGVDGIAFQRRLTDQLTRRGFTSSVVRRVVGQLVGEREEWAAAAEAAQAAPTMPA